MLQAPAPYMKQLSIQPVMQKAETLPLIGGVIILRQHVYIRHFSSISSKFIVDSADSIYQLAHPTRSDCNHSFTAIRDGCLCRVLHCFKENFQLAQLIKLYAWLVSPQSSLLICCVSTSWRASIVHVILNSLPHDSLTIWFFNCFHVARMLQKVQPASRVYVGGFVICLFFLSLRKREFLFCLCLRRM